MSKLTKKITQKLLECSTKEKEEIGNRIVRCLGGDPKKSVTNLPARRGNADGGIDGRIPVVIKVKQSYQRENGIHLYTDEVKEVSTMAAFCIKLEKKEFDRVYINSFIEDMKREKIFQGIIITASGLSPDARCILDLTNKENQFILYHYTIEDIISDNIDCDLKFDKSLKESFLEAFDAYLKE